MLIVADANVKALETAKHIRDLAIKAGIRHVFLIGNKIGNEMQKKLIEGFAKDNELFVLDFVPFDKKVVEAEMHGETPLKNPESEAMLAIERLSERLLAANN